MRPILLAALLSAATAPLAGLAGQAPPDPAPVRAAIAKLDFMVGRWRGEAWSQRGTERVQTSMLEVVQRQLDGAVLQVEGRGTIAVPGGEERVVHHAFAVISFDAQTGKYNLRSYLSTGLSGDFEVTLVEGGVRWSRQVPGGQIRNTALYTKDEWHEIGEFSRDGTTWTQIMEIKLKREP